MSDFVPRTSPLIVRAAQLADEGQCEKAIDVLASARASGPDLQNARGVCLMRLGRFADAVRMYRLLVLQPDCTWMKPGLPVIYRTNFATALLLGGLISGAVSVLNEINQEDHPAVIRLRHAIRNWERSLSLWQRLNWKLDLPPEIPVQLTFPPGDFVDPRALQVKTPPKASDSSGPVSHQVA